MSEVAAQLRLHNECFDSGRRTCRMPFAVPVVLAPKAKDAWDDVKRPNRLCSRDPIQDIRSAQYRMHLMLQCLSLAARPEEAGVRAPCNLKQLSGERTMIQVPDGIWEEK